MCHIKRRKIQYEKSENPLLLNLSGNSTLGATLQKRVFREYPLIQPCGYFQSRGAQCMLDYCTGDPGSIPSGADIPTGI